MRQLLLKKLVTGNTFFEPEYNLFNYLTFKKKELVEAL